MLSETDQRRLLMIFCFRCNGHVTLQDEEVAFQLRISNEEYATTKMLLVGRGFIDESNSVCNWDKRQYVSDSSVERVRKHRANKKEHGNAVCNGGNVTVTAPEQIQNRTDTEGTPIASAKPPRFDALIFLTSRGVNRQVAQDWLKARKTKRLAATQTAFEDVEREASKAGLAFPEAIKHASEAGWAGFKASWMKTETKAAVSIFAGAK